MAVVTGGAMGIGEGIAGELAAGGALVVVSDVNDAAGEETTSELKNSGAKAAYVHCNASSYVTGSLMFVDNGMTAQLEVFPE